MNINVYEIDKTAIKCILNLPQVKESQYCYRQCQPQCLSIDTILYG